MTTYSIRLEIPDTDLYNTDIEKIIYDGIKPIVLNKIENVLIDVIEIETEEEQINNHIKEKKEVVKDHQYEINADGSERIKEVIEECLKYYTMGDTKIDDVIIKTDKEEKENFVESVMMELNNSNTILIGKEKKDE
mgnify:CR=1 FL=1